MAIRAPDGAKKQTALKRICNSSNLISFITSCRLLQHILRNYFEPSIYYFDLLFFHRQNPSHSRNMSVFYSCENGMIVSIRAR